MLNPVIDEIYRFWFGDLKEDAPYFAERSALWFGGTDETDADVRQKFGAILDRAVPPGSSSVSPEFLEWTASPRGTIALIVLIDQFSLQLHRETPRSYDQSALMIPVTKTAIEGGIEAKLSLSEKLFLYLPLEHAENIPDQELSVVSFKNLVSEASGAGLLPAKGFLDYAERHARVVKKYGRFPDRNEVFGRMSTPGELTFLASSEAPF